MKRIILCISLFAFFGSQAQQINPVPDYVFSNKMSVGRNAVTDTAAYFSIGPRYGAIRGMMPPMVTDTANMSATKRNGLLIFSIQKNKYLYWDSVGSKWAEMAGTGGTAISSGDTASMLSPYIRAAGIGLTKSGQSLLVDTASIATRARVQKAVDSINTNVALKVNISDTASMLTPYTRGSGTTNYVAKFTAGSTIGNSQIFDNGTSVGIGTTTLTSDKLIINGFAYTRSGYKITNDTIDFRISHALGNRAYVGNVNAYPLSIFTDNTERIRILSTGAVGINTTTPASQLTTLGVIEGTNGSIRTVISYTGTGGVIGTLSNHPLELYANGALRGSISASGEFLLNTGSTDAGDYKLQVDGNIYNTGSITTGAPSGGSIKPWKIGEAATVSPTSPNRTIRVEIDGTVYYIHAKTTND